MLTSFNAPMKPIIRVEGLSKQYTLGERKSPNQTLRETIVHAFQSPFRGGRKSRSAKNILWALKNVNFTVGAGEVVGIIGRNGAGKSTLLKVLSRITEPTEGKVELYGRIGSLLEVGTGFHPELTGRENVYLNGSILGMSRKEIDRKFDDIVAFAEVEKFIDTPVKRYSSGMYVRLAFAVAAHLEPEILIVDEVLAVGDVAFQKKCLGKMGEVAREGRTVLFVSHNLGAINQLCSRALVMTHGKLAFDGNVTTAVSAYLEEVAGRTSEAEFVEDDRKTAQILAMSTLAADESSIGTTPHNEAFQIALNYKVKRWEVGAYVCLEVRNDADVLIIWACEAQTPEDLLVDKQPGVYESRITLPAGVLSPGRYYFSGGIYSPASNTLFDLQDKAVSVEVIDGGSLLSNLGIKPPAVTMISLPWETTFK